MKSKYFVLSIICVLISCSNEPQPTLKFTNHGRSVPYFSSDSAYLFTETQVNFGPREPNSEGHRLTRHYLEQKLRQYAGTQMVYSQEFTSQSYNGEDLKMANIIAAFNPASKDRVVLFAHWDTRPRADMDSIDTNKPILGADDGGSGVGVLLELARLFSENLPPIGVDIVLFDGEDYGVEGDLSNYFLGSRYWSKNPPVEGYTPRFGILLDMVGASKAVFPKEEFSNSYAPNLLNEIWGIAAEKGFQARFLDEQGARVLDDHYIVNMYTGIPVINIINHTRGEDGISNFGDYWHTHGDNMAVIGKETLQQVGEVLLELIYNRL